MKKFLKQLNDEFERRTPKMSDRVRNTPIAAERDIVNNADNTARNSAGVSLWRKVAAMCMAAVLVVGVTVAAILIPSKNPLPLFVENDSYITLDINPSFSIVADSDGKTRAVTANNRDAEIVLIKTDVSRFQGKDCGEVVEFLAREAAKLGYLAAETGNGLSLTAVSSRGKKATDQLVKILTDSAQAALNSLQGVNTKVNAVSGSVDELKRLAEKYGIEYDDDFDVEDFTEKLREKPRFLDELKNTAESDWDNAKNVLEWESKRQIFEEFGELLEDRQEALDELDEEELSALNEKIRESNNLGSVLGIPVGLDGFQLLSYAETHELDEDLAELLEEFSDIVGDAYELGLKFNNIGELKALKLTYSIIDFRGIFDLLEEIEDKLESFSEAVKDFIVTAFEAVTGKLISVKDELNEILSKFDSMTDPEEYFQAIEAQYEAEYEMRVKRFG